MKAKKRKAEYDGVWEERGRSLPVPSALRGTEKTLNRSQLTGLLPRDNRMEKKELGRRLQPELHAEALHKLRAWSPRNYISS